MSPVHQAFFNDIGIGKVVVEEDVSDGEGKPKKVNREVMIDWSDNIVIEFTSKFDKLGAKIFTSDILKQGDDLYVASFIDGGYYASHYKDEISFPLSEDFARNCEKVGNAFVNPEIINIEEEVKETLENNEEQSATE